MESFPSNFFDMVLADLPYGTTQNKWDSIINLDSLWPLYWRILKPTGIIALTASQPFTSIVVSSQIKLFRHEWIWIKHCGSNFANTNREPMKEHESVLVFSRGKWIYNKQMQARTGNGLNLIGVTQGAYGQSSNYGTMTPEKRTLEELRVPSSWQKFNREVGLHPTQKPVPLMEYLIKIYTNEQMLVLDNCMGSGTTGVACVNTNRRFVGIELNKEYFDIAQDRITKAYLAKEQS